ncbi:DUF6185 family protein [Streptomyces sp. NPDC002870]|uniref:DUF6185 family protein n=1 Tax=Streptomyces sp. NPDC002870 TaxID=3364666 RepID=UPI0036B12885
MSWLSDPTTDEYATRHGEHLTSGLQELAADGASWLLGYDTVLTALAIVALLRARGTAPQSQHAAPAAPDILLMMLLYTAFVTPLIGSYLNNGALVWLQIGLDIALLGLLLIVGGRRPAVDARAAPGCLQTATARSLR